MGPVPTLNREEKSDDHSKVVIQLDQNWRIIECKDGIQWILQSRKGSYKGKPAWRGRSYCREKTGLYRAIREKVGGISDEVRKQLDQLSEWFPERIEL